MGGTLLDCSTSDHASKWASPWTLEAEAPNLKPKCYYNKHYMRKKMKKKKKKRNLHSTEKKPISEVKDPVVKKEELKSPIVSDFPRKLVKCKREKCRKKFTSESALQYHISFKHTPKILELDENLCAKVDKSKSENNLAAASTLSDTDM